MRVILPILALLATTSIGAAPALAFACTGQILRINGHSLEPMLADHAEIPLTAATCKDFPERGDLAVFHSGASSLPLVKVVIAGPGDLIALEQWGDDASLRVNGMPATNSRGQVYRFGTARTQMLKLYVQSHTQVIPEGRYFVLGDSAEGTTDSSRFGFIDQADVETFVSRAAITAMPN
jgi:signal peptidase I